MGYRSETMYNGTLIWNVDASQLSNLHTMRLNYRLCTQPNRQNLNQWTQLLRTLDHFSAAPVHYIYIVLLASGSMGTLGDISTVQQLLWPRVGALLQRFRHLKYVDVRLACASMDSLDTFRISALPSLELISKEFAVLKSEGRAHLTCTHVELTNEPCKRSEFTF